MKILKSVFDDNYHDSKKLVDNWQKGILLLPITNNLGTSKYDIHSSAQSTVGQFIRLLLNEDTNTVESFEQSVMPKVQEFLQSEGISQTNIDHFLSVVKDLFFINGTFAVPDMSFFKYIPLVPDPENKDLKTRKKYRDGQIRVAAYLYSMLDQNPFKNSNSQDLNLVLDIFAKVLSENNTAVAIDNSTRKYTIPSYIKKSFSEDFKWFLQLNEQARIKYFHLFLHFYLCYGITQTILLLSAEKIDVNVMNEPEKLYFILDSEKISMNHDAILYGWANRIQNRKLLDRLFGKIQALDIANCLLGGDVGFYPQVLARLSETPFEDNREALSEILECYKTEKTELLNNRQTEGGNRQINNFDPNVVSYVDFLRKLERCCVELQSKDYVRLRKKILDIMRITFLTQRGGPFVLKLDKDMLSFLIALVTKGERTKLEDMYKSFTQYGICFNRDTKFSIEEYLLNMNLLDRKSDSGEVQYVKAVL